MNDINECSMQMNDIHPNRRTGIIRLRLFDGILPKNVSYDFYLHITFVSSDSHWAAWLF